VKSLLTMMLAGVLLGSVGFVQPVEAGDRDRKEWKHRGARDRDRDDDHDWRDRRGRRYSQREVRVIREHYRPHHRCGHRARHYHRPRYDARGSRIDIVVVF
jgi:Ni/Co efflux regulator RcnB